MPTILREILAWVYRKPRVFPIVSDLLAWPIGLLIGSFLKLLFNVPVAVPDLVVLSVVAMAAQAGFGFSTGVYTNRWRVSSFDEIFALSSVWAITSAILTVGNYGARLSLGSTNPTSAVLIGAMVALVLHGFTRGVWRRFWELSVRPSLDSCKKTIVFGAGQGAGQIIQLMLVDPDSAYYPVAVLDDDPAKSNREFGGVQVVGDRSAISAVVEATGAELLLIAIPSAPSSLIKELAELGEAVGLEVLVLPATTELVGGMTLVDVRPPTVDDLLGRDPVDIDLGAVADYIRGRRVLITGAGGSIGAELSRQVKGFGPSELYLLDRDESALHGLQLSMEGRALLDTDMLVVADIRDRDRMFELFERYCPEVVFHTAALKHLTLLENHPAEGMKTNTLGTKNLLEAARSVNVERFVNISTDKAADPTSVLGATKLAAERLTAKMAHDTGDAYVSVRFGNVLGSRGSVLPTFLGQIEQGKPITVTHPDVTRYFMTIPEAVRLVVQAGAIGSPGEVMVLDMGEPVKIVDLAEQLISSLSPSTPIEFTGLRPGEKLHEVLISETELGVVKSHPRITHTAGEVLDPADALEAVSSKMVEHMRAMLWESEQGAAGRRTDLVHAFSTQPSRR